MDAFAPIQTSYLIVPAVRLTSIGSGAFPV